MTAVASSGSPYQVVLVLDNFDLKGSAMLETPGRLLVKNGDLASNTTNTVSFKGGFEGGGDIEFPGLAATTLDGGGGSFALSKLAVTGNATIKNGTFSFDTISVGSALAIDGATVAAGTSDYQTNVTVTGDITLANGGTLKSMETTGSQERRLYVTAANVTVPTGCAISADGTGYTQVTSSYFRSVGNMNYLNRYNTTSTAAGGSYGGLGGIVGGHAPNPTYGNFVWPTDLGTSGGYSITAQGDGGGALRLSVAAH